MDTWGWFALANQREPRHADVEALFRRWNEEDVPRHTSDHVLNELATLLFRRLPFTESVEFMEGVFASAERSRLTVHRVTSERFRSAQDLRKRYQDKPEISFTDLTSLVLVRELDLPAVLTDDSDFKKVDPDLALVP